MNSEYPIDFNALIESILRDTVVAWNDKDFSKIEDQLSDYVYVSSPNVERVYPNHESDTLIGKTAVIKYWNELVKLLPLEIKIVETNIQGSKFKNLVLLKELNELVHLYVELDQYGQLVKLQLEKIES